MAARPPSLVARHGAARRAGAASSGGNVVPLGATAAAHRAHRAPARCPHSPACAARAATPPLSNCHHCQQAALFVRLCPRWGPPTKIERGGGMYSREGVRASHTVAAGLRGAATYSCAYVAAAKRVAGGGGRGEGRGGRRHAGSSPPPPPPATTPPRLGRRRCHTGRGGRRDRVAGPPGRRGPASRPAGGRWRWRDGHGHLMHFATVAHAATLAHAPRGASTPPSSSPHTRPPRLSLCLPLADAPRLRALPRARPRWRRPSIPTPSPPVRRQRQGTPPPADVAGATSPAQAPPSLATVA